MIATQDRQSLTFKDDKVILSRKLEDLTSSMERCGHPSWVAAVLHIHAHIMPGARKQKGPTGTV